VASLLPLSISGQCLRLTSLTETDVASFPTLPGLPTRLICGIHRHLPCHPVNHMSQFLSQQRSGPVETSAQHAQSPPHQSVEPATLESLYHRRANHTLLDCRSRRRLPVNISNPTSGRCLAYDHRSLLRACDSFASTPAHSTLQARQSSKINKCSSWTFSISAAEI
jgi:hypothetical protein